MRDMRGASSPPRKERSKTRAPGAWTLSIRGRDRLASRPDQPMMAVRVGHATLPMSVAEFDMMLGNAEGCMARLLWMRGHHARENRPYGSGPGPV